MLRSRHLKIDIRILQLCPAPGCIDHLRGCVDARRSRAALLELDGEFPIATAHVEDPAAANVADEFEDQPPFKLLGDGADLGRVPLRVNLRSQIGITQVGWELPINPSSV